MYEKEIINIVPVNQQMLSQSHMLSQEILLDTTESLYNLGLLEEDMKVACCVINEQAVEKGVNINDI